MDLSGYLEIFCMWYACCVDNRMCCAVGFCLVNSISGGGGAGNAADVRHLYDVWKFSASQMSVLRRAVTQNPV